ncbi:MAG: DUF6894 family protein [Bradyrhizobium sp.]
MPPLPGVKLGGCRSIEGLAMPLYFYRINYGQGAPAWPHEGVELPDDEAAWAEATTACGEMLRDLDGALKAGPEWRMEVLRESGEILYRLTFSAQSFEGDATAKLASSV